MHVFMIVCNNAFCTRMPACIAVAVQCFQFMQAGLILQFLNTQKYSTFQQKILNGAELRHLPLLSVTPLDAKQNLPNDDICCFSKTNISIKRTYKNSRGGDLLLDDALVGIQSGQHFI